MLMFFHTSLKLVLGILLYSLFTFPPSWLGHVDANRDPHAYISVWGGEFCQVGLLNCWRAISFKASLKVVAVMRHSAEMTRRPAGWMVDERRLP
jgi:hypothetical protein